MNNRPTHPRTTLIVATVLTASLMSGAAQAALNDRGGGLIYDDVLDVTWLQNANYGAGSSYDDSSSTTDGRMTWENAANWAANLSYFDSVRNVTYSDWRLPTVEPVNGFSFNESYSRNGSTDNGYSISAPGSAYPGSTASELAYMFYINLGNSPYYLPGEPLQQGCTDSTCLDNVGPFTNLQPSLYWSGTELAVGSDPNSTDYAWDFDMNGGNQYGHRKDNEFYAWAVRPGDVAAVPEPETYVMLLAGLAVIGAAVRRRG